MATDIGGYGDRMSELEPGKTEVETRSDGTKSDDVSWKLMSASGPGPAGEEAVSSCTMAGDHNTDECTDHSITAMEDDKEINLPKFDDSQEDIFAQQSPSGTGTPNSQGEIIAADESHQQAVLQESHVCIPSTVLPEAKIEKQATATEVKPIPTESTPQTNDIYTIPEGCFQTETTQVIQDSPKESLPICENQDCHVATLSQNYNAETASTQASQSQVAAAADIQQMNTKQHLPIPNSEIQDLGMFAHLITDPNTASFYREENLKPSINEVSHQPVSSLGLFNGSQQQPAIDSLPGITCFSQATSSNLAHGVTGGLNTCMSMSGNCVDNVVYAAVPLQQTENGMQLGPLHDGNAYTLAHPKNPSQRPLLPRGRSSGNNPKENSFKETVNPLTYDKPNVGLVQQITEVFQATGRKEMQPCEVYDALECCYPYYQHMNHNRKKSWMSSVRHALTSPSFKSRRPEDSDGKLAPRKGSFWSINNSYDPQEKPLKRVTPVKQSVHSPKYQRRPLEVNPQQVNWQPFPGRSRHAHHHHRSARHSPYNYFSPTRGSFSPVGPSNLPMMYSPNRVYQSQTPTAALLPNGKMIYLSPAQSDTGCHQGQSCGRNVFQAWGTDSNNNTPSLWQVVQNAGDENCKNQSNKNRNYYDNVNGGQQLQGNNRLPVDSTQVTNINCNNATMVSSLGFTTTTQQQQEQLKIQLLQQQIQQQQLFQEQQLHQQPTPAVDSDPFAVALELSEIKGKPTDDDKDQEDIKPQQEAGNINSAAQEGMAIEMTCTTEPQIMLLSDAQTTPKLTAEAEAVSTPSQQGCDELRNMVYQSLGVCNNLETRPAGSTVSAPTQLTNTPATQFSTMPATNYQLIHYSGNDQQFDSMVI